MEVEWVIKSKDKFPEDVPQSFITKEPLNHLKISYPNLVEDLLLFKERKGQYFFYSN